MQDADAHVRLAALLVLSELPASPKATAAILDLITVPQNARDLWLPDAAAMAGAKQGSDFVSAFLQRRAPNDSAAVAGLRQMGVLLARHYTAQKKTQDVVNLIVAAPKAANQVVALAMLDVVAPPPPPQAQQGQPQRPPQGGPARGWPEGEPPTLTAEQKAALTQAGRDASPGAEGGVGADRTALGNARPVCGPLGVSHYQ